MNHKTKQARTGDADLLEMVMPAGCGASFHTKNPSLTQAKAALQAGLIQPDYAALVVLVWAEVHLGLEVRP
jgi:hypothetical protein